MLSNSSSEYIENLYFKRLSAVSLIAIIALEQVESNLAIRGVLPYPFILIGSRVFINCVRL